MLITVDNARLEGHLLLESTDGCVGVDNLAEHCDFDELGCLLDRFERIVRSVGCTAELAEKVDLPDSVKSELEKVLHRRYFGSRRCCCGRVS